MASAPLITPAMPEAASVCPRVAFSDPTGSGFSRPSTRPYTRPSAPSSIDGVTLSSGDRVLLKDQTDHGDDGIYVFGGGINEPVAPVLVAADGSVSEDIYPGSRLNGGFAVLELPTREEAVKWAAKLARACRCSQELREFMYDPAS